MIGIVVTIWERSDEEDEDYMCSATFGDTLLSRKFALTSCSMPMLSICERSR